MRVLPTGLRITPLRAHMPRCAACPGLADADSRTFALDRIPPFCRLPRVLAFTVTRTFPPALQLPFAAVTNLGCLPCLLPHALWTPGSACLPGLPATPAPACCRGSCHGLLPAFVYTYPCPLPVILDCLDHLDYGYCGFSSPPVLWTVAPLPTLPCLWFALRSALQRQHTLPALLPSCCPCPQFPCLAAPVGCAHACLPYLLLPALGCLRFQVTAACAVTHYLPFMDAHPGLPALPCPLLLPRILGFVHLI